ncbi:hypothetical protein DFO57_105190 [Pantoea sp. AG702]|jgi:hypothetical protein|nr:hypothetical protein DFO57_105190 [Pantoea sp. AG702]
MILIFIISLRLVFSVSGWQGVIWFIRSVLKWKYIDSIFTLLSLNTAQSRTANRSVLPA